MTKTIYSNNSNNTTTNIDSKSVSDLKKRSQRHTNRSRSTSSSSSTSATTVSNMSANLLETYPTDSTSNFHNHHEEEGSIENDEEDEHLIDQPDNDEDEVDPEPDDDEVEVGEEDELDHYENDYQFDLKHYFDQVLFGYENSDDLNPYFCVCCRLKFFDSKDFLRHCHNTSNTDEISSKSLQLLPQHKKFKLTKDQEKFILDNLIIYKDGSRSDPHPNSHPLTSSQTSTSPPNSPVRTDLSTCSTSTTKKTKIENKIIVFLMEKKMKQKFLDQYSQDLLVANEETALCLEELNTERKKLKKEHASLAMYDDYAMNDDDSIQEENNKNTNSDDDKDQAETHFNNDKQVENSDKQYSLLFIDYSIIQFNRIIKNLKHLYSINNVSSSAMYDSSISSVASSSAAGMTVQANQFNSSSTSSSPVFNRKKDTQSAASLATAVNRRGGYEMNKFNTNANNNNINKKTDLIKKLFQVSTTNTNNSNNNNNNNENESALNLKLDNALKQLSENSNHLKKPKHTTSNLINIGSSTSSTITSKKQQQQITAPPSAHQLLSSSSCSTVAAATATVTMPVSTMHSRNACKKLKCPKCNWHYKYRETLDIHMREKHSSDLTNNMSQQCTYCVDNTPHPRLGRGEQYKCGYKPYRCDICDYSTTTKGNLSIHMQSDKHINNLKETKTTSVTSSSTSSSNNTATATTSSSLSSNSSLLVSTSPVLAVNGNQASKHLHHAEERTVDSNISPNSQTENSKQLIFIMSLNYFFKTKA